ncbi:hypothetical protein [Paratractidigestivibacter sp.]|uniref:hypothetical protein n=1 Tax=Paratractidigestivibacter sp. TaxID=2847316 RepID=UPI002ACB0A36|nr:hypothetical protein [Paratractidigestivibacter sp.]
MRILSGEAGTADAKNNGKKSSNRLYTTVNGVKTPNALITYLLNNAIEAEGGADKLAPTSSLAAMQERVNSGNAQLSDLGTLALTGASNHRIAATGLAGLGMGNVNGLMDNDKFGLQLLGGVLGAGAAGVGGLWSGNEDVTANPILATAITMGGGEIGALFDKLRAKKEAEAQQASQMAQYGNYRNNGGYNR